MRGLVLGLVLGAIAASAASACQYHQSMAAADAGAPPQVALTDLPPPVAPPVVEPAAPPERPAQTQSE